MQSIKVTIMGKQIPLKVSEDEVDNMQRIARFVDEKFRLYRNELSNQPDSTVMILASLSIAEELFEIRSRLQHVENNESDLMEQVNNEIEKLLKDLNS